MQIIYEIWTADGKVKAFHGQYDLDIASERQRVAAIFSKRLREGYIILTRKVEG